MARRLGAGEVTRMLLEIAHEECFEGGRGGLLVFDPAVRLYPSRERELGSSRFSVRSDARQVCRVAASTRSGTKPGCFAVC